MNKYFLSLILCLIFMQLSIADKVCDQETAFNMMMKLGQVSNDFQLELQKNLSNNPEVYNKTVKRFQSFSTRLGSGGQLLADKKYDEACALYQSIANDFNVDLDSIKVVTLSELQATADKQDEPCSLSNTAKTMNKVSQIMAQQYQLQKMSKADSDHYSERINRIGKLMASDHAIACKKANELLTELEQNYGDLIEDPAQIP